MPVRSTAGEESAMNAYVTTLKTTRGPNAGRAPFGKIAVANGGSPVSRLPAPVRASRDSDAAPPSGAATPAKPARFELRSTVRYRIEGRVLSGTIVGIAHDDPLRYDIRRAQTAGGKRRSLYRTSFGVPHDDIEKVLTPPPESERLLVLSDLPPEPPAPVGQGAPRPARRGFLAQLLRA
jgi:hypothetical protein